MQKVSRVNIKRTHVCTFSIFLVEFSHQPVLRTTSVHNELKQQCDGAGEHLKNENYELHAKSNKIFTTMEETQIIFIVGPKMVN